jgi:hypothetical protein
MQKFVREMKVKVSWFNGEEKEITRPTLEQVRWVFQKVDEHLREGGSYRYLIYDRMDYDFDSYCMLFPFGMNISNFGCDCESLSEKFKMIPVAKKVHLLDSRNYYRCISAVGNRIRGIATKNIKLVTCKNCLRWLKKKKKNSALRN